MTVIYTELTYPKSEIAEYKILKQNFEGDVENEIDKYLSLLKILV